MAHSAAGHRPVSWPCPRPCCLPTRLPPCREVERLAGLEGVLLRTGCICNPGACAAALGLTAAGEARGCSWQAWRACTAARGRTMPWLPAPAPAVHAHSGWMLAVRRCGPPPLIAMHTAAAPRTRTLPADMRANFEAGHVCWDERDVLRGRPTGAVRASFGFASSLADAAAVAALVRRYWLEAAPPPAAFAGAPAASAAAAAAGAPAAAAAGAAEAAAAGTRQGPAAAEVDSVAVGSIAALWVYPIKSCRGFSPPAWPLGEPGPLRADAGAGHAWEGPGVVCS